MRRAPRGYRTAVLACAGALAVGALATAAAPKAKARAGAAAPFAPAPEASSSEVSPEESLLVAGLEHLRTWKMGEAEQLLAQVCPEFTDSAGEGTTLEDLACTARAVSLGEVKGAKDASDRADGYWWGAERARRTQQIQVARAFLDLGLDRNPGDSDLWTCRGRLLRDTGDLEASNRALRRAIELDATNLDATYWLGANRMDQKDLVAAEELFRKILAKEKKDDRAWYRLGLIRMQQHDPRAALEYFEKSKAGGMDKKVINPLIEEARRALPKAPR